MPCVTRWWNSKEDNSRDFDNPNTAQRHAKDMSCWGYNATAVDDKNKILCSYEVKKPEIEFSGVVFPGKSPNLFVLIKDELINFKKHTNVKNFAYTRLGFRLGWDYI